MDSQYFDWATLPEHLLDDIVNKLLSLYDYLQFSLVCKRWYSVALHNRHERIKITSTTTQLPLLLVPPIDCAEEKRGLYDLRKNRICELQLKINYKNRCCGSSLGWLFMVQLTYKITLLNPFSGRVIHLPCLLGDVPHLPYPLWYHQCHVFKAILTKDPLVHPNDFIVAAIYGSKRRLAIFKANDKIWTYLNPISFYYFGDVNVHNDKIYALDFRMRLWIVDVRDHPNPTSYLKMIIPELTLPLPIHLDTEVYLVESSNKELLLIRRFFEIDIGENGPANAETIHFDAYRLSDICKDGMRRRVKIRSLGGDAIFLGDNQTICVSTKEFPSCLPNCIYFTNNNLKLHISFRDGPRDVGTFNLQDESFGTHYVTNSAHSYLPRPIWIIPTLM